MRPKQIHWMPVEAALWALPLAILLLLLFLAPASAFAVTVMEVAEDLACPCECSLVLADCNMTCGLDWKDEIGELIAKGMSKPEIMEYFIATYGEEARLTPIQWLEGKAYQYTRGFSDMEWTLLWTGLGVWTILLFAGFYFGIKRLFFRVHSA
jgi:cytochrome c-type biogenesis protein CcmH/NrfF